MNKVIFPRIIGFWLIIGLIMVFFQVVIGGITRLTDSGLSITEWDVIKGVIPPITEVQWEDAFQKYKNHTKQFEAIHADMNMSEFKFIYFWEWFHRLWARTMGFVFIIPFVIFWRKKWLKNSLIKDLGIVVALAALAAVFGWIMVQSGLNTEQYVWVDAYRLTIHLSIAVTLISFLFWTTCKVLQPVTIYQDQSALKKFAWSIIIVIAIQLLLGGLMSGMKAGLVAPYFPHMGVEENGSWIWISKIILDPEQWHMDNMMKYNSNSFAPSLIQVLHRSTAYILCILIVIFFIRVNKTVDTGLLKTANYILLTSLLLQVTLGILTVINSLNSDIFPLLGVLHQAFGILLMLSMLFVTYLFSKGGYKQI
jgi:cytochrome c oxidase assembly protein subunit 15